MSDWRDNIVPAAERLFAELRREFTIQQIKHIAGALERQVDKAERAALLRAWRAGRGARLEDGRWKMEDGGCGPLSVERAARELGLAVEDIEAIEGETLKCGPEAMRPIRRALRRCRADMAATPWTTEKGG